MSFSGFVSHSGFGSGSGPTTGPMPPQQQGYPQQGYPSPQQDYPHPYPPPYGYPQQQPPQHFSPQPSPQYPQSHLQLPQCQHQPPPQYSPSSSPVPQDQKWSPAPPPDNSPFPAKFYVWYRYASNAYTYLELGPEPKSEPVLFSAKLGMTGGMEAKPGRFTDSDAPAIGTVKDKHILSSKSILTLAAGGPEVIFANKSCSNADGPWALQVGGSPWGRWVKNKQSLSQKFTGENKGATLTREDGTLVARFTHQSDYRGCSKNTIGYFEFCGDQLTEEEKLFGVMAFLRMTQKQYELKMIKLAT